MSSLLLIIISVLLAELEPFLPFGSLVIAWSATLGVKKSDWAGLSAVLISGLIRDVVMVNHLGLTSAIATGAWLISALGIMRFNRPFLVAAFSTAITSLLFSQINHKLHFTQVAATVSLAVLLIAIWQILSGRSQSIKLRS